MSDPERDPREAVLEIPGNRTTVRHYPLREGTVVLRHRSADDPDDRGWTVEANIGGVIVEGAGHYSDNIHAARDDAKRLHQRIHADDARLAMWGELVEALEGVEAHEEHADQCEDCEDAREVADANDTGCREWLELLGHSIVLRQKTLVRARALERVEER